MGIVISMLICIFSLSFLKYAIHIAGYFHQEIFQFACRVKYFSSAVPTALKNGTGTELRDKIVDKHSVCQNLVPSPCLLDKGNESGTLRPKSWAANSAEE